MTRTFTEQELRAAAERLYGKRCKEFVGMCATCEAWQILEEILKEAKRK